MLEAEARGAMVMAVIRLEGGHTGATHMSHLQDTGRGSESTAFTSKLLSQKTNGSITGRGRESAAPTGKGLKGKTPQYYRERTRERCLHR